MQTLAQMLRHPDPSQLVFRVAEIAGEASIAGTEIRMLYGTRR